MQMIRIGNSGVTASRLIYGCMRLAGDGGRQARETGKRAVHAAIEAGYTLFDHADIYGHGACEALFGELLAESPGMRAQVQIASKCGVRFAGEPNDESPARYDFSPEHVYKSVDGSLRRLGIEQLDLLLLHRPDFLMRAGELAQCLAALKAAGKVAAFGVSNFSPSQVDLLQSAFDEPLLVNQVEINMQNSSALTDGTLDQCQRLGMSPQAWGPLGGVVRSAATGAGDHAAADRLRTELSRQAQRYDIDAGQVVLAWLLRHPADICPIIGSTSPARIAAATAALDVDYSRDDWYRLLEARNGEPVP